MFVCMYVCMYICMYVCMYVCMYICMYVCMYVYMYVCMYIIMYVCIYLSNFRGRAIAKNLTSLSPKIRNISIHRQTKGPTTKIKSILWIVTSNSLVIFTSYLFTHQFHHFLKYLTGPSKNNLTDISPIYTKRKQLDELLCIVIILTEIEYKGTHQTNSLSWSTKLINSFFIFHK